jgi:hypothetical protein
VLASSTFRDKRGVSTYLVLTQLLGYLRNFEKFRGNLRVKEESPLGVGAVQSLKKSNRRKKTQDPNFLKNCIVIV